MLQRSRNHGSTPGRRYILFHKTSIPVLPLVQPPIQCYTCTLKSPVTLRHDYYYLRNIHVYSPTNQAVFHSLYHFHANLFLATRLRICCVASYNGRTRCIKYCEQVAPMCLTEWTSAVGGQLRVMRGIRGAYENIYNP